MMIQLSVSNQNKGNSMATVWLSEKERNTLLNIITTKRNEYGPIKSQFCSDIKEYIRTLNDIKDKLIHYTK